MKDKTIIVSDVHLGSSVCQAKLLNKFLHEGKDSTQRIIINGDLFEDDNFGRLTKHHWRILSIIRKLSDHIEIIYIRGNHDLPADLMSHLLGVSVVEDYEFISGDKKIIVLHGHIFDEFINNYPIMTWIADLIYNFLQKIDKTHYIARLAKHSSKSYLRVAEVIKQRALNLAKDRKCNVVCCGHSHLAEADKKNLIHYYNSGCWTELPCSYLEIENGEVVLKYYTELHN